MPRAEGKDLAEIFGYAPDDVSKSARTLWKLGACPFVNSSCIKHNHDQSIIYGTCSVKNSSEEVIICPYRLYADNYQSIKSVSLDAFGSEVPFFLYSEFIQNREKIRDCIVALGQNSGKEIKLGRSLSMDWVIARIENGELAEYAGLEVQSIDITGNYRDSWHFYNNLPKVTGKSVPLSGHGLNWANVHKRLIPQLIRKGLVYSRSNFGKKGLYFVVPDAVYRRFEPLIGDIPLTENQTKDTLTVFTYELGASVAFGSQRPLIQKRKIRFRLKDFAERFIAGGNLPSGEELDTRVLSILKLK